MRKKLTKLPRNQASPEQREQARCIRVAIEFEDEEPILVVTAEALAEDTGYGTASMIAIENFWLTTSNGDKRLRYLKEKICRYGADLDPDVLGQVESFKLFRYTIPNPPSVT